jgi:flavin-dependent dehydrogenase
MGRSTALDMPENGYDAIVVGARCAGSPTALLLARMGYRVLVVDRATFPSDTISTHLIHPPGVAALKEWCLLDRLVATGCPPIHTYSFDFGRFTIAGAPGTDEAPLAYSPRRTVLDRLLVDAASEAGAEVREGFVVEDVEVEDGRVTGIRGHRKGDRPSPNELGWSWAPTATTRSWRAGSRLSSTTRSHRSRSATTRT